MFSKLSVGLLALLIALATLSGCREITVVSFAFSGDGGAPPDVDYLRINPSPPKQPIALSGMDETLGFYDLHGDTIRIEVWACWEGKVVLHGVAINDLPATRIIVALQPPPVGIPDETCPTLGTPGTGGTGAGGSPTLLGTGGAPDGGGAGATGTGGVTGTGGALMDGGAGATGTGGAVGTGGAIGTGGATGNPDAGTGGVGGACDDGGIHEAGPDLGPVQCETPVGAPASSEIPPFTTATLPCTSYCAQIFAPTDGGFFCPDLYADVAECERYCTLAAWPYTGGTGINTDDSLDCRDRFLRTAQMVPQMRPSNCLVAGPGLVASPGEGNACSGGMGACGKLCNAWSAICNRPGDRAACMTACAGNASAAACRMPWLLRAASDSRYCSLVSLVGPSCLPPGCAL